MTYLSVMQLNTPVITVPNTDPLASTKAEFGRLVHAAIINPRFRQMLLTNPENTIDKGFYGESFHFASEIKEQIKHIQAGTLEEFSARVLEIVETPSIVEMAVLHSR